MMRCAFSAVALLAVQGQVEAAPDAPWAGVDMSQLRNEDGKPFRASNTSTAAAAWYDALQIMADQGVDTFRMRMWNDPCADGRCNATEWSYANLEGVLEMARKCSQTSPPLRFVLDLHYSDWWADPGQQFKPAAWRSLSYAELRDAVYNFTKVTVAALVAQGTPPHTVQVGNEITNGMLYADTAGGQACTEGGGLWECEKNQTEAWRRLAALVSAGARGVRAAKCPAGACDVAIHTDLGNHIHDQNIDWVVEWYRSLESQITELEGGGNSGSAAATPVFDRIGLSMYPTCDGGHTFENLPQLSTLAAAFPGKLIYIAETSYPAAGTKQPEKSYAPTPEGQLAYFLAVRRALASALGSANGGVLWWEGKEDGWDGLFDENDVARPALREGFRPLGRAQTGISGGLLV